MALFVLSFSYSLYAGSLIKNSSYILETSIYPSFNITNRLVEILRLSKESFIEAIEFEDSDILMEDGKSIELKNKFNKTVEDLNAIIQHPDIDAIEKYYNSFIDQSIKTVLEYLNQLESEEVSNEGNLSEKIAVIAKQALELNKKIIQFQELKENEMKGALKNIRKQQLVQTELVQ